MSKFNLDQLPGSLLTTGNPKIAKGEAHGVLTAIMHLAPEKVSGRNVCPHAIMFCPAAVPETAMLKYAAAIAGKVYHALNSQIKRNRDMLHARQLKVKPPTENVGAEEADEDEDSDTAEAGGDEPAPIIVGQPRTTIAAAPPQAESKKLVQKTVQSKPSLSPVVIEFDRSGAEKTTTSEDKKTRPRIVKNK